MRIETWVSDKGATEIHHFIEGTNVYLFGFNTDVLGEKTYKEVLGVIEKRVKELSETY